MRKSSAVVISAALLGVLGACSRSGTSRTAGTDDLKKDLQLASTSDLNLALERPSNVVISPVELGITSAPTHAPTLHHAAGPKALHTPHPTVKAAPTPQPAVESPAPQPETQVAQAAPSPTPAASAPSVDQADPAPPPATRPSNPSPRQEPAGRGDDGSIGGILGGIFGAVIRGGVIDGDHCQPGGGRRGGIIIMGPYGGYPVGGRMPIPINP